MQCEDVLKGLPRVASGELPTDLRRSVRTHLVDCPDCRAALSRIDPLAGTLAVVGEPRVPAGFASRVLAAARGRAFADSDAAFSPARWWRSASVPTRVAAALVLLAGLTAGAALARAPTPPAPSPGAGLRSALAETYLLDPLGEAPAGSLADAYLSLLHPSDDGGR